MKRALAAIAVALLAGAGWAQAAVKPSPAPADRMLIERGQYLVAFGACNECHTPGWRESDGTLPPAQWMVGNAIGFRGPWGTVYPANVRLEFQAISEQQWLAMVATRGGHPPMTWQNLRTLSVYDRRAIYRFVRSLGPAGSPAPISVPPAREPATPYFNVAPASPKPG